MEYVNLIDYLDKPEEIQHVGGSGVRAIHHFPERRSNLKIVVVFQNGDTESYSEDGRYSSCCVNSSFTLKPKPKKVVKGYRKAILIGDDKICKPNTFHPTKESFEERRF